MDCSLPGSSAQGIFQVRVLEWVAIAFSRTCSSLISFLESRSKERMTWLCVGPGLSYLSHLLEESFSTALPLSLFHLQFPTSHSVLNTLRSGASLVILWLRLLASTIGARVLSLVEELSSPIPRPVAKKKKIKIKKTHWGLTSVCIILRKQVLASHGNTGSLIDFVVVFDIITPFDSHL